MNDQIQNFDNAASKEPVSIIVLDKDGKPLPVKAIGPTEVQDIEYSEDPKGN